MRPCAKRSAPSVPEGRNSLSLSNIDSLRHPSGRSRPRRIDPLLVQQAQETAATGGQRLRTRIHLCLRRGQPVGRRVGLNDRSENEHRTDGPFSGAGERRSPPRLHRHDRRGSQFPRGQGPAGPRKHPPPPPAGRFAPTQSQDDLWDELREKEFPNRVCTDMAGLLRQLEQRLPQRRCRYGPSPHHRGLALDS